MQDMIENRRKVGLASKIQLSLMSVRDNGILWFIFVSIYYVGSVMARFGLEQADALRRKKNLPGINSRTANKFVWENWDWSGKGDEWTISPEWKDSVVRNFIDPYFDKCGAAVEIGPGAGRWTEFLVTKTGSLIGVDISQVCVDECRKRFAKFPNARFETGNGRDIASVMTNSVDGIWSFDVFVHINSEEFSAYAAEFARVLKPGGFVVIQHGSTGGSVRGNRSNVTTAQVYDFMSNNGLEVQEQVQTWRDGGREYPAGLYDDTITIAHKPS